MGVDAVKEAAAAGAAITPQDMLTLLADIANMICSSGTTASGSPAQSQAAGAAAGRGAAAAAGRHGPGHGMEVEGGEVEGVVQFVASHHGHGSSTIGTSSKVEEATSGPELDFAVSHNEIVEFELHFGTVAAAVDECSLDTFSPCIETL